MADSCGQGDGLAIPREPHTSRNPSEAKSSRRQPKSSVITFTESPKIIHVKPENFKEVVQRLTGYRSSDDLGQDHSALGQGHSATDLTRSSNSFRPSEGSPGLLPSALEEYLESSDEEETSSQPSSNLGLFPTAGHVSGEALELELQWATMPDSIASSSPRRSASPSGTVPKPT